MGKNEVLSIYDGNSAENSTLVKTYTDMLPPHAENNAAYKIDYEVYSNTDKFVTFTSDYKNSASGFEIWFYEEAWWNCSQTVNISGSGQIASPGYPNKYPANSNCKFSEGKKFKISLRINTGDCYHYQNDDYITLYNSSIIKNEALFAVLKGKEGQSLDLIFNSEVLIVFVSDDKDNNNGRFVINYDETSELPTKISKPGELISGKGIIFLQFKISMMD